ncbi:MAG: class II aldolase/adducin family protein [Coriobacteriales bacterium]|nr:class II aldolase/adducin family protein [Actinomycetes bacterium]
MSRPELLGSFCDVGRDMFVAGLVTSHGGNLSVCSEGRIMITRRGSMLGRLRADDLIETGIDVGQDDDLCSRELVVHRSIYAATGARAIAHAHPVHTIARSLVSDWIVPEDSEGRFVLGNVPVVSAAETIASPEAGRLLAEALVDHPVAVLKSHGPFAIGATLEEAFYHVSALEASAQVLDLLGK